MDTNDLDTARAIFLADDVDDETRAENEEKLREWEQGLRTNQNFAAWEAHDITKQIVAEAKTAYKEIGITLATNRTLTDAQRQAHFAKQDAVLWLLQLIQRDANIELEKIQQEIKTAINATK